VRVGLADVVDVDPRIEARRADVRLARLARRRRRWLAGSIAMTVVVLSYALTRTALLDVDGVVVRGAVQTPPEDVRSASGVHPGLALTDVDEVAAEAGVQALPWVAVADVTRSWGGSVEIAVSERTAEIAVGAEDGSVALVDGARRVLAVLPEAPASLPLVRGVGRESPGATMPPSIDGALALARSLPPGVRTRVVAIDIVDEELEMALQPQGRVRVGTPERLDEKVTAMVTVFGQVDLTDLCVLDVRVPASPGLTRQDPCR
jgi:cell division protein FtsQ